MPYYPNLTRVLSAKIMLRYPNASPVLKDVDTITDDFEMACYLLWMLNELQKFYAPKRGRWMGYVQARMECLGLITNAENRKITKLDLDFQ